MKLLTTADRNHVSTDGLSQESDLRQPLDSYLAANVAHLRLLARLRVWNPDEGKFRSTPGLQRLRLEAAELALIAFLHDHPDERDRYVAQRGELDRREASD